VVLAEDATEFRLVRAACGEQSAHEWLFSWLDPEGIDPEEYLGRLEEIGAGWRVTAPNDRDELTRSLETADALVVEREPVDEELLERASGSLATVVRLGTNTANIDLAACNRRGIEVRPVARPSTAAVAEHTFMLLLAVAKNFVGEGRALPGDELPPPSAPSSESGGHPRTVFNWKGAPPPLLLDGRRLGVLGAGESARSVMRIARGFQMKVGYWSRTRVPELERDLGVSWLERDELPRWADVVSVHVAYAPELKHLVDSEFLKALGPDGILVNTARGLLVNIAALEEALRDGTIRGAGLDVFPEEPFVPEGLFELDNVALTPHVAAGSRWVLADDVRAIFAALNASR
jgi:glyoxylate reductase